MNLGKILNAFARLNPFVVKVVAENDAPLVFRNVFGLKILVGPKREDRAIRDYYAGSSRPSAKITKAMIGNPLRFINPNQGAILHMLMTPNAAPKASPTLRVTNPDAVSPLSSRFVEMLPERASPLSSAVDKRLNAGGKVRLSQIDDVD